MGLPGSCSSMFCDTFLRGNFTFDVVSWDDPDAPNPMPAGLTPQEAVNRFGPRPSECDIVVVVLWSRLGTPLDLSVFGEKPGGGPYLSGTEWEFEDAWGAKPRLTRVAADGIISNPSASLSVIIASSQSSSIWLNTLRTSYHLFFPLSLHELNQIQLLEATSITLMG